MSYTLDFVFEFWGIDTLDLQYFETAGYGYRQRVKHVPSGMFFYFDGNSKMGVYCVISGTSLIDVIDLYVRSHSSNTPFDSDAIEVKDFNLNYFTMLLVSLLELGCHFTRLDLAVDDVGRRYYSCAALHDIFSSGSYICKAKYWDENKSTLTSDCSVVGWTHYLGKRSSETFIRIYDKQLEQNGKRAAAGLPLLSDFWVRWELELKGDNAVAAVQMFVKGQSLIDITLGILSNYLKLINLDNERKTRCSVQKKWQRFLSGVKKAKIAKSKYDLDIDRKKDWLLRQCSRSLATVTAADGGSMGFIEHMLDKGRLQQSERDMRLISEYLEN